MMSWDKQRFSRNQCDISRRLKETAHQKEVRLHKRRQNERSKRSRETAQQKEARLHKRRQNKRLREIVQQKEIRLQKRKSQQKSLIKSAPVPARKQTICTFQASRYAIMNFANVP